MDLLHAHVSSETDGVDELRSLQEYAVECLKHQKGSRSATSFNGPPVHQQNETLMTVADWEAPDWHFDYLTFRVEQCSDVVNAAISVLIGYFDIDAESRIKHASVEVQVDAPFRCLMDDGQGLSVPFVALCNEACKVIMPDSDKFVKKTEKETGTNHPKIPDAEEVWMPPGQMTWVTSAQRRNFLSDSRFAAIRETPF